MRKFVFCLVALLLSAPAAAQEAVYLVRHAEQVSGAENPGLTPAGRQRARALAAFLRDAGITAVYSSNAIRTVQTATPTAESIGSAVRQVPREQTGALVERIRREQPDGRVLVVGHSETLPKILAAFGAPSAVAIDKSDYDNLFTLVPRSNGTPLVMRQRLSSQERSVFEATVLEPGQKIADVSTEQLKRILNNGSAVLVDSRPPEEFALSHIPGALNVAPKRGRPAHQYVSDAAEVGRLLQGAKNRPLILYCNGPFCGKTKRFGTELLEAGYSDVRRYQLGAPGWRALSGKAMQTEPQALQYIRTDPTAVWIDAREPSAFAGGTIAGARNIAASGLRPGKDQGVMKQAKDDGRLPTEDHNTRILVFGADGKDARAVADAIASEGFHNVSFVSVRFDEVVRAVR